MDGLHLGSDINEDMTNAELVNNDSFLRLKAKNRHKEIGRKIFYVAVALILAAFVAVVCIAVFFGLKKVEIKGNSKYTEEQILKACDLSSADNLLTIDLDAVEERIFKACPYISKISFKIALPSTLIVTITEDAPSYCTEIYGDYFLLSEDLRVISKHDLYEDIEVLDIPVIYLKVPQVKRAVAGERIIFDKTSSYNHTIEFLSALKEQPIYDTLNCIDATDRYHLILYANEKRHRIDIGTRDNLDTKLKFVKKVIEEAYNEFSIISFNVEKVNAIVVLERDSLFEYR